MTPEEAVGAWRRFADRTTFVRGDRRITLAQYLASNNRRGYSDEETIIQPIVFPRFADELLGFAVGENLAPERSDVEGVPDFTPADAVTHPFVFETKSTNAGESMDGNVEQIHRYLVQGRPRIKQVVLTNLVGLRVSRLDQHEVLEEVSSISLRGLLTGDETQAATTGDAQRLADFMEEFRFQELTPEEKLDRIRQAPPWNPLLEVTSPEWISARLDRVVELLTSDAKRQISDGALQVRGRVSDADRAAILGELRELDWRVGSDWEDAEQRTLYDYLSAAEGSTSYTALGQYTGHVAYYTATKLLLVRIWEDLGLVEPVLYNGGFDQWMTIFGDRVHQVIKRSEDQAGDTYPSLFSAQTNYQWFTPTTQVESSVLYELANTYFGKVERDVLGVVYERLLNRVDRKLVGAYYTPPDIVSLIWDMLDLGTLADTAADEDRPVRVLDVATGSGGFLVDAARRLHSRFDSYRDQGAAIPLQSEVNDLSQGLVGVEKQRFPAFLAELNLLIQVSPILKLAELELPPLGVLNGDTLSFHNPIGLTEVEYTTEDALLPSDAYRESLRDRLKDPARDGSWFDIACGNPPYIGEKLASPILRQTRSAMPYWEQFVAPHLDYLYWFLILGVSKLRQGGRFGFITTEYWLRADGARPLRQYLADRCRIDTLMLFRDMRLFPDAPGQHSMIVIGERVTPPDHEIAGAEIGVPAVRPRVSIYTGPNLPTGERKVVIDAMREGSRSVQVRSFNGAASPNSLRGEPWTDVILTTEDVARRRRLLQSAEDLIFEVDEGLISGADRMTVRYERDLTIGALQDIGGPGTKHGIFVLSDDEVASVGALNAEERSLLRKVVNTKDVYPYAAVLPASAKTMLYLVSPERGQRTLEELRALEFPEDLPALRAHLSRFRGVLERKVEGYGERRSWWSIHRPRPTLVERDNDRTWADYAITTRWGSGEKLIVGLAPNGVAPQSSLHCLAVQDGRASYLVGLMNSTIVQQIAENLPPGQIRKRDLQDLGLPFVPAVSEQVAELAETQADAVRNLVETVALSWPDLSPELRMDTSLASFAPTRCVLPSLPAGLAGRLDRVGWVEDVALSGAARQRAVRVREEFDLFGLALIVEGPTTGRLRVRLAIDDAILTEAATRVLNGCVASGMTLRDIAHLSVPISATRMIEEVDRLVVQAEDAVTDYRSRRSEIDSVLEAVL